MAETIMERAIFRALWGLGGCVLLQSTAVLGLTILPEANGWESWWLHHVGGYFMGTGLAVCCLGFLIAGVDAICQIIKRASRNRTAP